MGGHQPSSKSTRFRIRLPSRTHPPRPNLPRGAAPHPLQTRVGWRCRRTPSSQVWGVRHPLSLHKRCRAPHSLSQQSGGGKGAEASLLRRSAGGHWGQLRSSAPQPARIKNRSFRLRFWTAFLLSRHLRLAVRRRPPGLEPAVGGRGGENRSFVGSFCRKRKRRESTVQHKEYIYEHRRRAPVPLAPTRATFNHLSLAALSSFLRKHTFVPPREDLLSDPLENGATFLQDGGA